MSNIDSQVKTNSIKIISQDDQTAVVAGYGVVFGGKDLEGETFTPATDFMLGLVPEKLLLYDHGLNKHIDKTVIGKVVKTAVDDFGLWIEGEVDKAGEYATAVLELIKRGVLGWSSGSVSHLTRREGNVIKSWPIVEFSLTPTPAEPRTLSVQQIKQLADYVKSLESLLEMGEETHEQEAQGKTEVSDNQNKQEKKVMSDETTTVLVDALKSLTEEVKALKEQVHKTEDEAKRMKVSEAGFTPPSSIQVVEDETDKEIKRSSKLGLTLHGIKNLTTGQGLTKAQKAVLGQNESVPSEGGYLVQTEEVLNIEKKMFDMGPFTARVQTRTIRPGANSVNFYGRSENSRATGSRYGGVQGYRVAEGQTITASSMNWYKYRLEPSKYAAVVYATDELLSDSNLLEQEVMEAVPEELAFMVNDDILNGTSAGYPAGIMSAAALISVTKEVGQAANTIVFENIIKMWARLWTRSKANAAWYINTDTSPQLMQMNAAVGTGGQLVYMPPGGLSGAPYATLFGRPVIETEFNETLGTVGDILLADLSQYRLANVSGGVKASSSIHVQFLTDQTVWKFTTRYDGQSTWETALTPYKGTNTVSPFVALATRS